MPLFRYSDLLCDLLWNTTSSLKMTFRFCNHWVVRGFEIAQLIRGPNFRASSIEWGKTLIHLLAILSSPPLPFIYSSSSLHFLFLFPSSPLPLSFIFFSSSLCSSYSSLHLLLLFTSSPPPFCSFRFDNVKFQNIFVHFVLILPSSVINQLVFLIVTHPVSANPLVSPFHSDATKRSSTPCKH